MVMSEPVPDDSDLVYAGRARKRPSGASELTQRIYMLLHDHPAGMTLDEIHAELAQGWLETDYYRAYQQHLQVAADRPHGSQLQRGGRPRAEYGSELFKERAQRWAIRRTLQGMAAQRRRSARHVDGRWYTGERAPRITVHESRPRYITHDWAAERRDAHRTDTANRVRREQIKAELFTALTDGRLKGRTREVIQHAYDYLSGN
jgi:hypothetical protein